MGIIVKICGVKTAEVARAAQECGADLLGFVFAPSKRRIEPARVRVIARDLKGIGKVGVFVNAPYQEIVDIVQTCRLDYVQLHGDRTAAFCRTLPVPVIRAFPAAPGLRPAEVDSYEARWALLDTFVPGQCGGTGQSFDWRGMRQFCRELKTPVLIAGGLTPENVAEAVGILQPGGVDVSGGVETEGSKDPAKIDRFIRAVRGAERGNSVAGKDITG